MAKSKYGIVKNNHLAHYTHAIGVGASEVFSAKSGRFVELDGGSGDIKAATSGAAALIGAVDFVGTASSTEGGTELPVQTSTQVVYEMPVYDGTTAGVSVSQDTIDSYVGRTCDLYVASNIQYADTNGDTDETFIIVGGDADENTLYVVMNPAVVSATGNRTSA